jgi:succinate dehydrogenase/fumarate reductase cytochrome b subunit
MIATHLSMTGLFNPFGSDSVAWGNVAHRSGSVFFTAVYIILLAAALYHGLYGFKTIMFELGLKRSTERTLVVSLWFIGVALFVIGTFAAIVARQVATKFLT